MHPVIQKTFGGLTRQYYTRQLFFSCLMLTFFAWFLFHAKSGTWQHRSALMPVASSATC